VLASDLPTGVGSSDGPVRLGQRPRLELDRRNRFRVETSAEAARLDGALRAAWAPHPRFHLVGHRPSFFAKVAEAVAVFARLLDELGARRSAGKEIVP